MYTVYIVADGCLQAALSSGEWYIDNNMSTEQQELVQRVGSMSQSSSILPSLNNSTSSGANSSSSSREVSESSPRLIPVKSFQNTLLNMSVSSSNWRSSLTLYIICLLMKYYLELILILYYFVIFRYMFMYLSEKYSILSTMTSIIYIYIYIMYIA